MVGAQILFGWAIFVSLINIVKLFENGLARTPPMGWMSWGYYRCGTDCKKNPDKCLTEDLILAVADSIYKDGYQEAGFEYIIIDDCWSEHVRGKDGKLVPDKRRFPHGMKYIADYVHARGLKFGMYTTVGWKTCEGFPGSKGYFGLDTMTFAEWGVDYLKVDGCFVSEADLNTGYVDLGHFLNKTNRPILYSCSWPYYIEFIHKKKPDYDGVATRCNSFRIFHDVALVWPAVRAIVHYFERIHEEIAPYHGPGQWIDPDMLVLGTRSLNENQSRVQFVVYAMMSAPLILSCDMKMVTDYEKRLLQNMDLIAINQDPLGIMAEPVEMTNLTTLWVKRHYPMKGDRYHSFSFALVNLSPTMDPVVSFTPRDFGLESSDGYTVLDVLSGNYIRNITISDSITAAVPGEDVILYTLFAL